jgi:hypothetical protein
MECRSTPQGIQGDIIKTAKPRSKSSTTRIWSSIADGGRQGTIRRSANQEKQD